MSVLSEWDIINELGRGILIHPFNYKDKDKDKEDSLRGCCLCLTASEYAYIFPIEKDKEKKSKRLEIQTDSDSKKRFFKIPAGKTAVLWTNESIFITGHFCGSIHSKVKLVSSGIGHIGTRVNPNWRGILAVALHNLSNTDFQINVNDTIAYLRFYRLSSKSSYPPTRDSSGKLRDAIPEGFDIPRELDGWINNDAGSQWRKGEKDDILQELSSSTGYKNAKDSLKKKAIPYRFIYNRLPQWEPNVWFNGIIAFGTAVLAVIGLISLFQAFSPTSSKQNQITPSNQQMKSVPETDRAPNKSQ